MDGGPLELDFDYDDEVRAQLQQNGFVILPSFLTRASLSTLSSHCQQLIDSRVQGLGADRIINAHQTDRQLFELASHPKILDVVQQQIGPNILLWSTHLLAKEPFTGRAIPPHQDSLYWDGTFPDIPFHLAGNFSASFWIPLSDATLANGTMEMLPCSHKQRMPFEQFQFQVAPDETKQSGSGFGYQISPDVISDRADWVTYDLKAGQAALHDVLTVHRSGPNTSAGWRTVLVLRYMSAEGAKFDPSYSYVHFATGESIRRELLLVRGEDVEHRGHVTVPTGLGGCACPKLSSTL